MDKEKTPIDIYCERMAYKKAIQIDEAMAVVIKPKPKWIPDWLYHRVIRDSVELVQVNSHPLSAIR